MDRKNSIMACGINTARFTGESVVRRVSIVNVFLSPDFVAYDVTIKFKGILSLACCLKNDPPDFLPFIKTIPVYWMANRFQLSQFVPPPQGCLAYAKHF